MSRLGGGGWSLLEAKRTESSLILLIEDLLVELRDLEVVEGLLDMFPLILLGFLLLLLLDALEDYPLPHFVVRHSSLNLVLVHYFARFVILHQSEQHALTGVVWVRTRSS